MVAAPASSAPRPHEPVTARLGRDFFDRETLEVAPDLLGRILWSEADGAQVCGRIVEVEAYCGVGDPGSHASRGPTPRSKIMFGPPGRLYVYFTYGMHHCANLVTDREGTAGAVLIRAVEPLEGLEAMALRRGTARIRDLARGPGRLCQAFGIDLSLNGSDLKDGPVWVSGQAPQVGTLAVSPRIGLRNGAESPWRFYEAGSWASPGPRRSPRIEGDSVGLEL